MSIIDAIDRLIQERGSAAILRERLALLREQGEKEMADKDRQHQRELTQKDARIEKLAAELATVKAELKAEKRGHLHAEIVRQTRSRRRESLGGLT